MELLDNANQLNVEMVFQSQQVFVRKNSTSCDAENATVAEKKLQSDGTYGDCIPSKCKEGYKLSDNKCVKSE